MESNKEKFIVTYSTNAMGPHSTWYKRHNVSGEWVGGRIDIYGLNFDEYYNGQYEIGLPIMSCDSWISFSKWLDTVSTDDIKLLSWLVKKYEADTNQKIVWWDDVKA